MRKRLLAGNWKMFKLNSELPQFFESFIGATGDLRKISDRVDVMFAVPYTLLAEARRIAGPLGIRIAAQNTHWEASGAFTGEVSLAMLKELDIGATLIGHSERRQYFAETDETVRKKTAATLAAGLTPIVCVGETRAEREAGRTKDVVTAQVQSAFADVNDPRDLVIAYEPVWAIGTGLTASNQQAQEVHLLIRNLVGKRFGAASADAMRILYGGSAKPDNISGLLAESDIDGGLVGGASLKATDFAKMVLAGAER